MPTLANHLASPPPTCVNPRLLGTALAGLLCLATAGCSGTQDASGGGGAAGTPNAAGGGGTATGGTVSGAGAAGAPTSGGTSSVAGAGGSASAEAGTASGGAASGSGGLSAAAGTSGATNVAGVGTGGATAEAPHITSSKAVGVMTAEDFKALCDQRGGTVEIMPHCGGFATAKGVSYDNSTQLLSEHTCMGANTCGGWNCVID